MQRIFGLQQTQMGGLTEVARVIGDAGNPCQAVIKLERGLDHAESAGVKSVESCAW